MVMTRSRPARAVAVGLLAGLVVGMSAIVPRTALAASPVPTQLWSQLNNQEVIGVQGGSTSAGASVITWTANGHPDQRWQLDYTTGAYQAIVDVNSGQCMGVQGGSTSEGAHVIQWPCNGHADQQWALRQTNYGSFAFNIVNLNTGFCLGIWQANPNPGAQLVQWPCNGHLDQDWFPDSVATPPEGWLACSVNIATDTCASYTDPVNVVFYDPNRGALADISNDLAAVGWAATSCFNPLVRFDSGWGQLYTPDNVMATDVSNNGCGSGTRDHARFWASPDDHTVYIAASYETPGCSGHCVTDFNGGRETLLSNERSRLTGRTAFTYNEVPRYRSGSLQGVSYDGFVAVIEIG